MAKRLRPQVVKKWKEARYIDKWLKVKGNKFIYTRRLIPEVILSTYENELIRDNKSFEDHTYTSFERLEIIKEYVDFALFVYPRYRKLIKLYGLKGADIGRMLGYSSAQTWHNSYKRYTYIRFLVTMIEKHEEALSRLKK